MKARVLILSAVILMLIISCNNGMGSSGHGSSGSTNRVDRSKRTTIDASKYVDLTVRGNNAVKFTKQDIMFELNGKYIHEYGKGYITISRKDGTITISSSDAFYQGEKGKQFYASYVFDVDAASSDCLYIKSDKKKQGQMLIGNESYSDHDLPDLAICLPLYGFSRNRIEVSPVMNGFIAMPSGTYWAEKK